MKIKLLGSILLAAIGATLSAAEAQLPPPDAKIQGFYAWDKAPHGIMKLHLKFFRNPDFKKKFWANYKQQYDQGKRKFMIVELVFTQTLPGCRVPTPEAAREDLKNFLQSTPDLKTYPELLYAVVPSEEHRIIDIPNLNKLYDFIKKTYHLSVFQWLSEPLPPAANLKADGWIFDAYGVKNDAFYRHCRKFMLTGKPVFPILWFSEVGFGGYYKNNLPGLLKNAGNKIAICRTLNLPIFWFAVCKKHGSVNCFMSNKPGFPEFRAQMQKQLDSPRNRRWTPQAPVQNFMLNNAGEFNFTEKFQKFDFIDQCAFIGGRQTILTPQGLQLGSEFSILKWKFRTPASCERGVVTLTFAGKAPLIKIWGKTKQLAVKKGKLAQEFSFDLKNQSEFTVELRGANYTLQKLQIRVQGQPNQAKQLKLTVSPQGKVSFTENLASNFYQQTAISSFPAANIKFTPGLAVLMKREWSGVQKIVFSEKIKQVNLIVRCFADQKNWACSVEAGLSLDGQNIQWETSINKKRGEALKLALTNQAGFSTCYFHLRLKNNSGVYRAQGAPARFSGYILTGHK